MIATISGIGSKIFWTISCWVSICEGGMRITLWRIHDLHCRMNQRVVVYARRERRPRYNHPFHSKIGSLKDRLVWPKVKDADCTEMNIIYPTIRPPHRNSPYLHNVISQIVKNAPKRPTSYQAPRSTYLVPVPSQPQPLVITIPRASFFAPKVPQILTLRPIPKPMVITYPPSKGPITISLLEPYTGNHAVPWNYGIEATTEQGEKSPR